MSSSLWLFLLLLPAPLLFLISFVMAVPRIFASGFCSRFVSNGIPLQSSVQLLSLSYPSRNIDRGIVLLVLFLLLLRLNCLSSSDRSSCCPEFPALLLTLIVDVACHDVANLVSAGQFWAEGLRKMEKGKEAEQ